MSLPDISPVQLRYFLLVVDTGSFQAAAAKACRSQPALSLAIRQLEARLGQPLLEQGNRSTLTPYGQYCVPLMRDLLARHDSTLDALERHARSETGTLSLGTITAFATNWLPELVSRYREQYPNVALRLLDDNSINITRMVLAGEVDFGVTAGTSADKGLTFEPLITDAFGLVCRHDHALARKKSLRWEQLEGLTLIGTTAHGGLTDRECAEPVRRCALYASNMISLLSMIERGVGVTVLAKYGLPPWMDQLVFVPLTEPRVERTLGMLCRADRSLSPAAAAMHGLMKDCFAGRLAP
ncbi:LysR family transcriptional regulator [Bordetella sp. N]|uniref:LysR family transcriptional regulator n=1 Tax=Bordetella sp. N TaxID=1746199 RepID=UPI00070BFFFF|nr:LysR family transcriptional regulator [Bordetella sp. N]ALM83515.1 LysR family transcriptional regulator [Bordetella sp. N]